MIHEGLLRISNPPSKVFVSPSGNLMHATFSVKSPRPALHALYRGISGEFDVTVNNGKLRLLFQDMQNQTLLLYQDTQNWKRQVLSTHKTPSSCAIVENQGLWGFYFIPDNGKNILVFQSLLHLPTPAQWIAYAHADCRMLCAAPYKTGAVLAYVNPDFQVTLQFVDFASQVTSAPFVVFDAAGVEKACCFLVGRYVYLTFCAQSRLFALRFDTVSNRRTNIYDVCPAPTSWAASTKNGPALYTGGDNALKITFSATGPHITSLPHQNCRVASRKVFTQERQYLEALLYPPNAKEAVAL